MSSFGLSVCPPAKLYRLLREAPNSLHERHPLPVQGRAAGVTLRMPAACDKDSRPIARRKVGYPSASQKNPQSHKHRWNICFCRFPCSRGDGREVVFLAEYGALQDICMCQAGHLRESDCCSYVQMVLRRRISRHSLHRATRAGQPDARAAQPFGFRLARDFFLEQRQHKSPLAA